MIAEHGVLAAIAPRYLPAPPEIEARIGWLLALTALCLLIWGLCRAESWRRAVLGREDPRIFAALRIAFATITLVNFVNMLPIADLLWSDEGMFTLEAAQRRWGSKSLDGWTSQDGFLGRGGWTGFAHFLTHEPSLLVLHGSPAFVHGYLAVFFASLVCFAIGFRTRVAGVVTWFLMIGLYDHNAVYFEGTDTVMRCVWWVLLFARTDAAWSVDAAIRRRTEARRIARPDRFDAGRLFDRLGHLAVATVAVAVLLELCDQPTWPARLLAVVGVAACVGAGLVTRRQDRRLPAASPRAAEDPLEPVPRFPRLLIMVQVAAVYLSTGLVKTGIEWRRGDALHYAINHAHLARFEIGSAALSRVFGSNLFHLATWITLAWEVGFGLVLLGGILRFDARHRRDPWGVGERRLTRRWFAGVALVAAWTSAFVMARTAYPFMLALAKDGAPNDPTGELRALSLVWWVVIPLLVAGYLALRDLRLVVPLPRGGRITLDRATLRRWVLGRRVWLGVGVVFHVLLILTLNIGMFPFVMLAAYLAFFESEELLDPLRRWYDFAPAVPAGAAKQPRARLPRAVCIVALGGTLWFVLSLARAGTAVEPWQWSLGRWLLAVWALAVVVALLRGRRALRPAPPDPRDGPGQVGAGPPLIVSPVRRVLVVAFVALHLATLGALLLPTHAVFDAWRRPAQRAVMPYAELARVRQSWRMFAPNPPRSSTFMRTTLELEDDRRIELGPSFFEDRPTVFWINDRRRKMHRRMVGKGKWYLTPWGEAHCRAWVRAHGEVPRAVIVERIDERISPPPRYLGDRRPDAAPLRSRAKQVRRIDCGDDGGVDAGLARRWGIEPLPGSDRAAQATERRTKIRDARKRARWEAGVP